jgi:Inositol hexakisphosphate
MAPTSSDCNVPVNTKLPLQEPYRTGSYLIYDYVPSDKIPLQPLGCPKIIDTHFREGSAIGLRASGSRQLDFKPYADALRSVALKIKEGGTLYVVDLRQESHVFFNDRAVSWYADMDWANVGQSEQWIRGDEASQIASALHPDTSTVRIFCVDQESKSAGRIVPNGYSELTVTSALSEEDILKKMLLPRAVKYIRIPATDHCKPNSAAVDRFVALCKELRGLSEEQKWVHFHCHGGDGRTTTFLAMYDMFCWAMAGKTPISVKDFSNRQWSLFCYCLDPHGCGGNEKKKCNENTDWKCALARERWEFLGEWHSLLWPPAMKEGLFG